MNPPVVTHFNWVDLLILVMLGRGIFLGFKKGSAWGIIRFIGIIVISLIAFARSYPLAKWTQERFLLDSPYIEWVFFILLGLFLSSVINFGIGSLIRMLGLSPEGWVGRAAGMVLGAVQASVLISLIMVTMVMSQQSYLKTSVRNRSFFGAHFMRITPVLFNGFRDWVPGRGRPSPDVWRSVSEV